MAQPTAQLYQRTLRDLRRERGLSLRQAAQWMNMAHSTLSRIERGIFQPNGKNLLALSDFYGLGPAVIRAMAEAGRKERG